MQVARRIDLVGPVERPVGPERRQRGGDDAGRGAGELDLERGRDRGPADALGSRPLGDQRLDGEPAGAARPDADDVTGLVRRLAICAAAARLASSLATGPVAELAVVERHLPGAHASSRLSGSQSAVALDATQAPAPLLGTAAAGHWQCERVPKRSAGLLLFRRGGGSASRSCSCTRAGRSGPGATTARGRSRRARSTRRRPRAPRRREFEEELGQPAARPGLDRPRRGGPVRRQAGPGVGGRGGPRRRAAIASNTFEMRVATALGAAPGVPRGRPGRVVPTRGRRPQAGAGAGRPSSSACSCTELDAGPGRLADSPRLGLAARRHPADEPRHRSASASRSRPARWPHHVLAHAGQMGGVGLREQGEPLVGQHGQQAPAVRRAPGPLDQAPAHESVDHPADRAERHGAAGRPARSSEAAVGGLREVHRGRSTRSCVTPWADLELGLEHPGHHDERPGEGPPGPLLVGPERGSTPAPVVAFVRPISVLSSCVLSSRRLYLHLQASF